MSDRIFVEIYSFSDMNDMAVRVKMRRKEFYYAAMYIKQMLYCEMFFNNLTVKGKRQCAQIHYFLSLCSLFVL